ncbi:uncharacterized protein RAG0_11733 [Rhynchosporium agropyri]|uniref:Uncharacterized protein n=1 Tax=Rhynchosporium agropyri TaxID=914238 RepID=A0A1E1L5I8_9HELO|nr:uncharacterized protein RAG0_11733 [Rhynchosporium agropyri]
MPAPTPVPILSYSTEGHPVSNMSIGLDATVLHCWRDNSNFGNLDPAYPYYGMELQISCWKTPYSSTTSLCTNHILARYTGGKLKKDALYQFHGRFFIDHTSKDPNGENKSYFHVDEAIRFQGPGTLRSFRMPRFLLVGVVEAVVEKGVLVRWTTRDPYRGDMQYEQQAVVGLERELGEKEVLMLEGELCMVEGRMEGLDLGRDLVGGRVKLC